MCVCVNSGSGNVKASVLPVGTIVGCVTGILLLVAVLLGVGYIKHTRRQKIPKEQSPLEEVPALSFIHSSMHYTRQ